MKIIIVDNEKACQETLKSLLITCNVNPIDIIGSVDSIKSGYKLITTSNPDLVFLDINSGNEAVFESIKRINPINFQIVFVSAREEYAIKAIKFGAIDYLLKPFSIEELKTALTKVQERLNLICSTELSKNKINNFETTSYFEKKMPISFTDKTIFIEKSKIEYCIADSSYCYIVLNDGTKHHISKSLRQFERELNSPVFIRIHGSYLINKSSVKTYKKGDGGSVILNSDTELSVSRKRKPNLMSELNML
jgi:two-component system LytT family response regulator